jgi:hypothetical protein
MFPVYYDTVICIEIEYSKLIRIDTSSITASILVGLKGFSPLRHRLSYHPSNWGSRDVGVMLNTEIESKCALRHWHRYVPVNTS